MDDVLFKSDFLGDDFQGEFVIPRLQVPFQKYSIWLDFLFRDHVMSWILASILTLSKLNCKNSTVSLFEGILPNLRRIILVPTSQARLRDAICVVLCFLCYSLYPPDNSCTLQMNYQSMFRNRCSFTTVLPRLWDASRRQRKSRRLDSAKWFVLAEILCCLARITTYFSLDLQQSLEWLSSDKWFVLAEILCCL